MSYRQKGIIKWGPKNISFKECECPWCKSKDQKKINYFLAFLRYGPIVFMGERVYKCNNCGNVYWDTGNTGDDINE